MDEKIRIQKYLSDKGIMSRRAAEKALLEGRILVNGAPAQTGQKIDPVSDAVSCDGVPVRNEAGKAYLILNKPRGYVTTLSDEKGRKCVAELLADVGRLDLNSEGLLFCTNDGELTNRLMHPRYNVRKTYHIWIKGGVSAEQLERLNSPQTVNGVEYLPPECRLLTEKENHTVLRMILSEGKNREIRNICEHLGLPVIRLKRVAEGKLRLGELPVGKWRYLTGAEMKYIKEMTE